MRWTLFLLLGHWTDALGSSRIAGGTAAIPGQFPEAVFVVAHRVSISYCSGSILTANWVLTAAHCVLVPQLQTPLPATLFRLYAGILDYYTRPRPLSAQMVLGKRYVVHPGYRLFNATNNTDLGTYNDVALIETASPFLLNDLVDGIPLLTSPPPQGRVRCLVAGFGKTERGSTKSLRYLRVRLIIPCAKVAHQELRYLYRSNRYLCSFSLSDAFTMTGDSGSALQCDGLLVGVNFWVKRLHNAKVMVVIAIYPYLEWIRSHIPDI